MTEFRKRIVGKDVNDHLGTMTYRIRVETEASSRSPQTSRQLTSLLQRLEDAVRQAIDRSTTPHGSLPSIIARHTLVLSEGGIGIIIDLDGETLWEKDAFMKAVERTLIQQPAKRTADGEG